MVFAEVRKAAYVERHVSTREADELEEYVNSLEQVVLMAPMSYPVKQYMALWKDYLPEATCVSVGGQTNVVVVIPVHDAAQEIARLIQRSLVGSVGADHKFGGPAYRTIPRDFKTELIKPRDVGLTVQAESPPKLCVEGFAGSASLSAEFARAGFQVRAFEKFPHAKDVPLEEGDIFLDDDVKFIAKGVRDCTFYHLIIFI